jgi:hypothetical protein
VYPHDDSERTVGNPAPSKRSVELWILFTEPERGTADLRRHARNNAARRGWAVREQPFGVVRNGRGRPNMLLRQSAAVGLYRSVHRKRVGILDLSPDDRPEVCTHPVPATAIGRRFYRSVAEYTQYKALYLPVRGVDDAAVSAALGEIERWVGEVHCGDCHDPRCLPFHLFEADHRRLDDADERDRFNARYGGASRVDDANRSWKLNPRDFHAVQDQDRLHVAGCDLPLGYHWDVESREADFQLCSPEKVVSVRRYAHVNVYPDGTMR